jgi:hypothetical protein
MMTYVYAITDRPEEPLPGQLGLDDAKLAQVDLRDIGAVISLHDGARLSASADQLWRHEEVIEALMDRRAVLPVRFGTMLASEREVADMLCRAYSQFLDDIERVRDHVEIGMRFLATAERQPEADLAPVRDTGSGATRVSGDRPAPGTAYLQAKVARERTLRHRRGVQLEMVHKVYATLASHASAGRLDAEPANRQGISAAFLVPRDRLAGFRVMVGWIADVYPELALLCTGPWPAYSFVSANAGKSATSRGGNSHVQ